MFKRDTTQMPGNTNQYGAPKCYELAGKSIFLRFDDGLDIYLNFLDERFLLLGSPGETPTLQGYCCMKSDDLTYFVHIDRSKPIYAPISLALDFEDRLVTRVDAAKGSPDVLHWFKVKPCFGYIDVPGASAPQARHEISDDLIGSKIEWHYNELDSIYHIYMQDGNVRLGIPPVEELSPQRRKHWLDRKEKGLDLFEEPVLFIKIKPNKYLTIFCECNMAQVDPNTGGAGILLMDVDKVTDVGIFFTFDKNNKESYAPVAAFGRFTEREFPQDTMPSRYRVRYGVDGTQVYPPAK